MFKATLLKSLNARSGQVPLRFRLQDGKKVDFVFDTRRMVDAVEDRAVAKSKEDASSDSVAERFKQYLEKEHGFGRISDKKYRESKVIARKLERYLIVKELSGLRPEQFTEDMLTDFEKFCVDEYLYAANPKHASIYPRDYEGSRQWPKRRLNEESFRKSLVQFHTFWNDLVAFGEIDKSPYDGYVPWMHEKKHKCYTEMMGDPVSLTKDEFMTLISTPVPERLSEARNAFILQFCAGCRGEEFKKLTLENISVSNAGIPYLHYTCKMSKCGKREYDIEVPLVRIAFDIVMRTRLNFFLGTHNAAYNRAIQELLHFCGITREVCLYNNRTGVSETVRICDAMSQGYIHRNHQDLVNDAENLRGCRGSGITGIKTMSEARSIPMKERLHRLNLAFGQKPYRTDANLNIIEGAPFTMKDPLIYKEQPEKLPGGRTNPYVLSMLAPLGREREKDTDNVSLRYAPDLGKARPVIACEPFLQFLESLEEEHRQWIQHGIMLLKILGDFNVTFVRDCSETVYSMWSAPRGHSYSIYFYVNADTIVLLDGCLSVRHRKTLSSGAEKLDNARGLRWKHVIGKVNACGYDAFLDENFGARGSAKREINEMRACSRYVSQSLRQARIEKGLSQQDIFSQWGFKEDCGNLAHAENGTRVLPFKYLSRLLSVLGYEAVAVRPGLDGWNAISRSTTLCKLLESPEQQALD